MNTKSIFKGLVGLGVVGLVFTSAAQTPPLTSVVTTRGYTEVQQSSGIAVQKACANFGALIAGGATLSADQADFKNECDKMVRTARILLGGNPNAGNNNPNLGANATDDTVRNALQQVAPEEMAANSKLAIEASARGFSNAIRGRLSALRAGSGGLSLNGMDVGAGGKSYAATSIFGRKQSGGGAAADSPSRLGGFVNGTYNKGDKDTTDREDGFDFDNFSLNGGVDYRFTDNFVAGLALSYNNTSVNIVNSQGNIDSKGLGLSGYGTFYIGKLYLDGHVSYYRNDYDSTRKIAYQSLSEGTRDAKGSTNGNQYSLSFGAGYDFSFGAFTVAPYGRAEYLKLKIDAFEEGGAKGLNMHVDGQDVKSLQTAIGGRVSYAISTGFGVLIPQAGLEWNHEFDNDSRSVTARFINDPQNNVIVIPTENPDRDYYTLSLGVSGVFKNGFSAFANYETTQGLSNVSHQALMLGLRKEW